MREIVRNPAGGPVSPGATLKSVKITARVGSLGSDVLVVPRRQAADSEVSVRPDLARRDLTGLDLTRHYMTRPDLARRDATRPDWTLLDTT